MSEPLNPYFQVGLDVRNQPCLVIGGGEEGEEKSGRLLAAGADLTVVSPRLTERLGQWVTAGQLRHRPRRFELDDLTGAFLVLNTVRGDHQLSRQVYERARRDRILVNCYDSPDYSNFGMVALVAAGHLRLAISTSNASPSLAGRLRQDLEQLFDAQFVEYIEQLARVRAHLKAVEGDSRRRFDLLRELVTDFQLSGVLSYPPGWRQRVAELLARR
ncbi:MAG: bifunctional precorrin-2 dehydrogenase/sirohydrochlorin ferrochelatase [Gemmatimonadota bacterium]